MGYLSFKTPLVYRSILGITLLVSYVAVWFPMWIADNGIILVTVLVILFGVPHGAADCLILNYSNQKNPANICRFNFYTIYIALIVGDIICWYFLPALALSIFIAISIYHLGQSNLGYLFLPVNNVIKSLIYCCWGAFVIFVPILADLKAVTAILEEMLGKTWLSNLPHPGYLLVSIVVLNLLLLGRLTRLRYISRSDFWKEAINLLTLTVLFVSAPLIVSFGVYFTLWHSFSSTLDQIGLIRRSDPTFSLKAFYVQTAPLTLISIVLFVLLTRFPFKLVEQSSLYPDNTTALISLFFIGLSAITLPHAVIRDSLYKINPKHVRSKSNVCL